MLVYEFSINKTKRKQKNTEIFVHANGNGNQLNAIYMRSLPSLLNMKRIAEMFGQYMFVLFSAILHNQMNLILHI